MESHVSPKFKKWLKKCLNEEFSSAIEENLNGEREPYDVAQKIINSRAMTELSHAIRTSFLDQLNAPRPPTRQTSALTVSATANSRPQTSLSFVSDLSEDEEEDDDDDEDEEEDEEEEEEEEEDEDVWGSAKEAGNNGAGPADEISKLVELMSQERPDHVRLAGYEGLPKAAELGSLPSSEAWPGLLKALRDGLVEGSRSVFEASLLVHAKLLNCPRYSEVYGSLVAAFTELYQSRRLSDSLPTLLSGVNFKIFIQEKLFRTMRLLVEQHEEVLKGTRTVDRVAEEMIEQFVSLLASHSIGQGGPTGKRPLNPLQVISVLEPRAGWSRRWLHGLTTRRALCAAIGKALSLLRNALACVERGLERPPAVFAGGGLSVTIADGPGDVFISGESLEALGFLHCLHLLSQLCASSAGRALLAESLQQQHQQQHHQQQQQQQQQQQEAEEAGPGGFDVPGFLARLLSCLNGLAGSAASHGLYEAVRAALRALLAPGLLLYDGQFCQLALSPLLRSELRMWPHTLDALGHVLDSADGPNFMIAECRASSASLEARRPNYPVVTVIAYAASLLRQPVAVMSSEHVTDLFRLIGKIFRIHEVFCVAEEIVRERFYPAITYMYSKLDKYYIENEIKTQILDKAVKEMLLSLVSIPLGLQMLSGQPLIFDELIRGSIAPVRASWSAYEVIGFVANSGFLSRGPEVLAGLAPHVLSTLLAELGKGLEDPRRFYDPWESADVNVLLHVLALFSLNTRCFLAFMTKEDEGEKENNGEEDNNEHIANLHELFQRFLNVDSPYHHLGLLAIRVLLWNLDIYLYLLNLLDFQSKLLEFQGQLAYVNEAGFEARPGYAVDECGMLRHAILLGCHYVRPKRSRALDGPPEETRLFSELPPPPEPLDQPGRDEEEKEEENARPSSGSELAVWLYDSGPGLRDNSWVIGTRRAHKASPGPIANNVLLNLLDQMEKAIPTVEWVDGFKWDPDLQCNDDYWLPEEMRGIDLILHYSAINGLLESTEKTKTDLKVFIQSAHHYINYDKSANFNGFDWFLATVFLICSGNVDKLVYISLLKSSFLKS